MKLLRTLLAVALGLVVLTASQSGKAWAAESDRDVIKKATQAESARSNSRLCLSETETKDIVEPYLARYRATAHYVWCSDDGRVTVQLRKLVICQVSGIYPHRGATFTSYLHKVPYADRYLGKAYLDRNGECATWESTSYPAYANSASIYVYSHHDLAGHPDRRRTTELFMA